MLRKPDCMYRIVIRNDRWHVSAFQGNVMLGPTMDFSNESVPDWIHRDVSLLNLVDRMGDIKNIGQRVGEAYWLNPKEGELHED